MYKHTLPLFCFQSHASNDKFSLLIVLLCGGTYNNCINFYQLHLLSTPLSTHLPFTPLSTHLPSTPLSTHLPSTPLSTHVYMYIPSLSTYPYVIEIVPVFPPERRCVILHIKYARIYVIIHINTNYNTKSSIYSLCIVGCRK